MNPTPLDTLLDFSDLPPIPVLPLITMELTQPRDLPLLFAGWSDEEIEAGMKDHREAQKWPVRGP